jgi:hypothetical protein
VTELSVFPSFIFLPLLVAGRSVPIAAAVVGMQPSLAAWRTNNRNEEVPKSLVGQAQNPCFIPTTA